MRKVKIQAADPINEEDGLKVTCRIIKNRLAKKNPYLRCDYFAIYGEGIDSIAEIPDILEREGIVRKAGSWYYWEDENGQPLTYAGTECKFRSKSVLVNELRANPELREKFDDLIAEAINKGHAGGSSMTVEEIEAAEAVNKKTADDLAKEIPIEELMEGDDDLPIDNFADATFEDLEGMI